MNDSESKTRIAERIYLICLLTLFLELRGGFDLHMRLYVTEINEDQFCEALEVTVNCWMRHLSMPREKF